MLNSTRRSPYFDERRSTRPEVLHEFKAMARKRKRSEGALRPRKQPKFSAGGAATRFPVLTSCYPKILTLREYFLARLPSSSRVRRKRIKEWQDSTPERILDTSLVGILSEPNSELQQERARELASFTQTQRALNASNTARGQTCSLAEVIDFVIWLLFKSCPVALTRPKHLLCNGLQRATAPLGAVVGEGVTVVAPGIFQQHPNENLDLLTRSPWDQYLSFLGSDGEAIFCSLLLDCGLFFKLDQEANNYLQISGSPVSDLSTVTSTTGQLPVKANDVAAKQPRRMTEISFVRNRILYGKPALNRNGQVQFGLKHVHVLQRYSQLDRREHTVHVMKHVFPRQFGLHSAFTSQVDSRESSQRFLDYTYREQEIDLESKHSKTWIPRRLRGEAEKVIQKIRRNHARCSYSQLLRHYCLATITERRATHSVEASAPAPGSASTGPVTQPPSLPAPMAGSTIKGSEQSTELSFLSHATPISQTSAFCRSVLLELLPRDCFGRGADGEHNQRLLLRHVDRFVKMRRFETMNVHEVCHCLRIRNVSWLQLPKQQSQARTSKQDMAKRLEILHELIYYIFDSLLIPLIRSNFYVTESGLYRYKLFYFRHDIWRKLSEPSLTMLRINLYQPLKPKDVRQIFNSRTLGYSNVRLLPKAEGTRPITNLRRRMLRVQGGRRLLGPSINSQLAPVFSALGYERQQDPAQLGSAIFSINGLHEKLKQFKSITSKGEKLYLVKLDIQSCFDTIPQARLLDVINKIIAHPQYRMIRYAELKKIESNNMTSTRKCRQKFTNLALPTDQGATFSHVIADSLIQGKDGVVLLHTGNQKVWQQYQLFKLLREHVQNNVVKIGKKHFKQTNGIPQGSVLSSILCSLFYSDFERKHLDFITNNSSVLVRLIDDFLLLTTDKGQATRFLEVMTRGQAGYGISVNPDKTLVNFEVRLGAQKIRRHPSRIDFPYCGMTIDTTTLEVRKDWQRKDALVSNGLTVAAGNKAATAFRRKVLLSFKLQLHAVLLDAILNSPERIMSTYLEAFEETAMKMHQYLRNMPSYTKPSAATICSVMSELINVATKLGKKKQSSSSHGQTWFLIPRAQICWLASTAFERVLLPKQSSYQHLLAWLRSLREASEVALGARSKAMQKVVDGTLNSEVVAGCVY